MDFAAVDSVYENLFSAQNFFALHEQNLDKQNYIDMVSTAIGDLDRYRREDGGGDARGSLLLGDDYCSSSSGSGNNYATTTDAETAAGTAEADATAATSDGTTDAMAAAATGTEAGAVAATSTMKTKTKDTPMIDFDILTMMGYRPPNDWPSQVHSPRISPTIQIGEEIFALKLDTIFVLGMRLNVTKNDMIVFFGKMGRIQADDVTMKPKIFVYKNKLTGRSKGEATITYTSAYAAQAAIHYLNGAKFLGHVLGVVPAYLSTRAGRSVRFRYAQETGCDQRRQRLKKWKPAYDNWVCELCRNSNFVWRIACNRCRVGRSEAAVMSNSGQRCWRPRKRDWTCNYCCNVNFWYRQKCNRCSAPKAELKISSESERDKWELVVSQTSVV